MGEWLNKIFLLRFALGRTRTRVARPVRSNPEEARRQARAAIRELEINMDAVVVTEADNGRVERVR